MDVNWEFVVFFIIVLLGFNNVTREIRLLRNQINKMTIEPNYKATDTQKNELDLHEIIICLEDIKAMMSELMGFDFMDGEKEPERLSDIIREIKTLRYYADHFFIHPEDYMKTPTINDFFFELKSIRQQIVREQK